MVLQASPKRLTRVRFLLLLPIYQLFINMKRKELRQLIRECLTEMMGIDDDDPMDAQRENFVKSFDFFTKGYFGAALTTSTNDKTLSGSESLYKNYTYKDFHIDTLKRIKKDCEDFQKRFGQYFKKLDIDENEAGTMFWLSRNNQGIEFQDVKDWRNEYTELWGDLLSKAAKSYGTYHLYVADSGRWDGLIFGYPA